jgi:hypothetical protein
VKSSHWRTWRDTTGATLTSAAGGPAGGAAWVLQLASSQAPAASSATVPSDATQRSCTRESAWDFVVMFDSLLGFGSQ